MLGIVGLVQFSLLTELLYFALLNLAVFDLYALQHWDMKVLFYWWDVEKHWPVVSEVAILGEIENIYCWLRM